MVSVELWAQGAQQEVGWGGQRLCFAAWVFVSQAPKTKGVLSPGRMFKAQSYSCPRPETWLSRRPGSEFLTSLFCMGEEER